VAWDERRYAVKATPTMVLFNGGKEVESARKDLQGYRTFEALRHFLHFFIVPNPFEVNNTPRRAACCRAACCTASLPTPNEPSSPLCRQRALTAATLNTRRLPPPPRPPKSTGAKVLVV